MLVAAAALGWRTAGTVAAGMTAFGLIGCRLLLLDGALTYANPWAILFWTLAGLALTGEIAPVRSWRRRALSGGPDAGRDVRGSGRRGNRPGFMAPPAGPLDSGRWRTTRSSRPADARSARPAGDDAPRLAADIEWVLLARRLLDRVEVGSFHCGDAPTGGARPGPALFRGLASGAAVRRCRRRSTGVQAVYQGGRDDYGTVNSCTPFTENEGI